MADRLAELQNSVCHEAEEQTQRLLQRVMWFTETTLFDWFQAKQPHAPAPEIWSMMARWLRSFDAELFPRPRLDQWMQQVMYDAMMHKQMFELAPSGISARGEPARMGEVTEISVLSREQVWATPVLRTAFARAAAHLEEYAAGSRKTRKYRHLGA